MNLNLIEELNTIKSDLLNKLEEQNHNSIENIETNLSNLSQEINRNFNNKANVVLDLIKTDINMYIKLNTDEIEEIKKTYKSEIKNMKEQQILNSELTKKLINEISKISQEINSDEYEEDKPKIIYKDIKSGLIMLVILGAYALIKLIF